MRKYTKFKVSQYGMFFVKFDNTRKSMMNWIVIL